MSSLHNSRDFFIKRRQEDKWNVYDGNEPTTAENCGTDIDREVVAGWVQRKETWAVCCFWICATPGIVQAVVRDDQEIYKTAKSLGREYVVMAKDRPVGKLPTKRCLREKLKSFCRNCRY